MDTEGPTLSQCPDVVLMLQNKVESFRGVHDSSDAGDAGQLQKCISNARTTTSRQTLQCLHQEIQTSPLQELNHPDPITGLQPLSQAREVHH